MIGSILASMVSLKLLCWMVMNETSGIIILDSSPLAEIVSCSVCSCVIAVTTVASGVTTIRACSISSLTVWLTFVPSAVVTVAVSSSSLISINGFSALTEMTLSLEETLITTPLPAVTSLALTEISSSLPLVLTSVTPELFAAKKLDLLGTLTSISSVSTLMRYSDSPFE